MADNMSPPLPESFSQGNPPPGYPTQAPQPHQVGQQPVITQQREAEECPDCMCCCCCCSVFDQCC